MHRSLSCAMALLAVMAGSAQAQSQPAPKPQAAPKPEAPSGPKPEEIISALSADINGDASMDRLMLAQNEEGDATLYVYLGKDNPNGGLAFQPPIIAKGLVFAGPAFGQQPTLEMNKNGTSLLIRSQNESIGREHWTQTLTIAWRNGALVIAGLTYRWYDTMDLKKTGSCDVNFLSGRAIRNDKPHPDKVAPLTLAAFDSTKMPKACQF